MNLRVSYIGCGKAFEQYETAVHIIVVLSMCFEYGYMLCQQVDTGSDSSCRHVLSLACSYRLF